MLFFLVRIGGTGGDTSRRSFFLTLLLIQTLTPSLLFFLIFVSDFQGMFDTTIMQLDTKSPLARIVLLSSRARSRVSIVPTSQQYRRIPRQPVRIVSLRARDRAESDPHSKQRAPEAISYQVAIHGCIKHFKVRYIQANKDDEKRNLKTGG